MRAIKVYCPPGAEPPLYAFIDALDGKLKATTLLCALDRIFDDAMVFKLRGESFRGKKLETISLQTGKVKAVESVTEMKG